jgi:hypothetical protein
VIGTFARKEQTTMEHRIEVFSTHEIQKANFELLHGILLLLVEKGFIKQEEVTTMCSLAKKRLESGAAPVEGHMALAYVDLFLQTLQRHQAPVGKTH